MHGPITLAEVTLPTDVALCFDHSRQLPRHVPSRVGFESPASGREITVTPEPPRLQARREETT